METDQPRMLVIAKPEAVKAGLVEQMTKELTDLGLTVVRQEPYDFFDHPEIAKELYREHAEKSFYREPVLGIMRGMTHIFLVEGPNVVATVRDWLGPTKIREAMEKMPASFRGRMLNQLGLDQPEDSFFGRADNIGHASSDDEAGEREAELLFPRHRELY